jgi:hypothetical protein
MKLELLFRYRMPVAAQTKKLVTGSEFEVIGYWPSIGDEFSFNNLTGIDQLWFDENRVNKPKTFVVVSRTYNQEILTVVIEDKSTT